MGKLMRLLDFGRQRASALQALTPTLTPTPTPTPTLTLTLPSTPNQVSLVSAVSLLTIYVFQLRLGGRCASNLHA